MKKCKSPTCRETTIEIFFLIIYINILFVLDQKRPFILKGTVVNRRIPSLMKAHLKLCFQFFNKNKMADTIWCIKFAGISFLFHLAILWTTTSASSILPVDSNQRGDSGTIHLNTQGVIYIMYIFWDKKIANKLSFCNKLKFCNPFIFAIWWITLWNFKLRLFYQI